jgi:hypothetical protein
VNFALNFANQSSPAKLPENEYIAYTSLQSLSRRSRYLLNEKDNNLKTDQGFLTYEKHLARALRHLNTLLNHFAGLYQITLPILSVRCQEIKTGELNYFKKA